MVLNKALLLLTGLLFALTLSAGRDESPRRIEIAARRFSYKPNEITLKKGERVTLVFRAKDVTHGIKIDEFNVNSELKKGRDAEITVTPKEVGHFEGRCAYYCGTGHGSMTLQINVVE
jgi:cytochrome c oxidase subunit II